MPEGQEDLLLRIQSDVAAALADLQRVSAALSGVSTAAGQAGQAAGGLGQSFGEGTGVVRGFFETFSLLPPVLQEATGAIAAMRFAVRELTEPFKVLADITIQQAEQFAAFTEQIHNTSIQLGISQDFVQAFRVRLQMIGQDANTGGFAMRVFSNSINAAADGSGKAAELFQRLGVQVTDVTGQIKPTQELLFETATALSQMDDGAAKVALTLQLFGRQGSLLLPIFAQMAQGSDSFVGELKKLNIIIGDDLLVQGNAFAKQWGTIGALMDAQRHIWGSFLAEALNPFVTGFKNILEIVTPVLIKFHTEIVTATKVLAALTAGVAAFAAVAAIQGLVAALTAAFAAWATSAGALAITFGVLNALIGNWPAVLAGIAVATGGLYYAFHQAGTGADELKDKMDGVTRSTKDLISAQNFLRAMLSDKQATALADATVDQLEKVAKSRSDAQKAEADQAAAELEHTKGRLAAIDARVQAEKDASDREAAIATARLLAEFKGDTAAMERSTAFTAIAAENENRKTAIAAKGKQDREALAFSEGQAILKSTIDADEKRQLAQVSIAEEELKQLKALHQISDSEELKATQELEDQKLLIRIAHLQQDLEMRHHEPEEIKKINDEIATLQNQRSVNDAAYTTKVIENQEKERIARQTTLDAIQVYYDQAFGTPQQVKLDELAKQHQKLREEVTKLGPAYADLIPVVDAAYAQLVANTKGAILDIGTVVKTGIEDMFAGIILGTKNWSQIWATLRDSMVKQFTQAFAEIITKKLGFEGQLKLNVANTMPEIGGQAAQGFGNPFGAVMSLLSGGSGVSPGISFDASGTAANWMGGTPAFLSSTSAVGAGGLGTMTTGAIGVGAAEGGGLTAITAGVGGGAGAGGLGAALGGIASALPVIGAGLAVTSIASDAAAGNYDSAFQTLAYSFPVFGLPIFAIYKLVTSLIGTYRPTAGTQALRVFKGFVGTPDVQKALQQLAPELAWGGSAGTWLPGLIENAGLPLTTGASQEASRQQLEALAALILSKAPPIRGSYAEKNIQQFATAWIESANKAGVGTERLSALVDDLITKVGGSLPAALDTLNKAFGASWFFTASEATKAYATAVAGLAEAFTKDLPTAALTAIQAMATAGKVTIDQLNDYINSVMSSAQLAKDMATAAVNALLQARAAQQSANTIQARDELIIREQRLKSLQLAIDQAQRFGDMASAAQLQMQLASEQAAVDAAQAAATVLTPGEAFLNALSTGIQTTITTAIVDAVVKAGIIQVALAPLMQAITDFGKVVADPTATMDTINAGLDKVRDAAIAVKPSVAAAGDNISQLIDILSASGVLDIYPTTTPGSLGVPAGTGAAIMATVSTAAGKTSGSTSSYAPMAVHVNLAGATILDEQSAGRLASIVGEGILRKLKQQRVVGGY